MNATNSPEKDSSDSLVAAHPGVNATVSASAGSGKTWLLVTRIIRLLLDDAEPGSILALTFTRKAAAEMQMRLQERLFQLASCDQDQLISLLQQAGANTDEATLYQSRLLYEKLLYSEIPVRLQTFHSFCQDILSHFPLEAEITPGFELIENTALLQQQAWDALFTEATQNTHGHLANDLDVLMQACNGPTNTKTALNSMLNHRNDWWAYCEHQSDAAAYASQRLQQQLDIDTSVDPYADFFSSNDRNTLASFSELLGKHPTKPHSQQKHHLDRALSADTLDQDAFDRLQLAFLTTSNQPRSRKPSKAQAAKMGDAGEQQFLDLHNSVCAAILHTREIIKRIQTLELNAAWFRTGEHYIEIYQRIKREQRVLDFADLEWHSYRLLNTADNANWVQYKIDQRINHVLIDEFQDTNPTQWQLLTPLLQEIAAGDDERARSIFLVGDEKQSIYSFRRANPALQQQASDWLSQTLSARSTPLDSSRRSSSAIIDAVNAVFTQEEILQYMPGYTQHDTHLRDLPGTVTVFPLCTLEPSEEDETVETTRLRNPLLQPRAENLETARAIEASLIADQIEKLVAMPACITDTNQKGESYVRKATYSDIMILMRNRTHISEYESVLRDRGIPFIGSQRGSLLDNQEIQDLEVLLDSLITPFNNLSIAQVLKSPVFSASDDDLIAISQAHRDKKWFERLQLVAADKDAQHPLSRAAHWLSHWSKLADTIPVHDLIDRIYAEGNIVERYSSSVAPAQRQRVRANLQRFHEMSLELNSGRYPSLSHFLHYLRSIRLHKDSRPDEPAASNQLARVSLLTIHASKGLEAPVVILADCDHKSKRHNAYSTLVNWPAGESKPTSFQLITSKDNIDSVTTNVLESREHAQHREELNLLYVALTRARQHLLVTGVSAERSNMSSGWHALIETAMQTLTDAGDDSIYRYSRGSTTGIPDEHTATATDQSLMTSEAVIATDPRLKQPITGIDTMETVIAPSFSFQDRDDIGSGYDRDESLKRGHIIHRALELFCHEPPRTIEQTRQQLSNELAIDMNDAELNECIEEAHATINNEQFTNLFKPLDKARCYNELPVMYAQENKMVYGIIDRLIVHEDRIELIDYKTHRISDESTLSTLSQNYKQQLSLYREGIKRIWPERPVKSGLLFTNSARLIWID